MAVSTIWRTSIPDSERTRYPLLQQTPPIITIVDSVAAGRCWWCGGTGETQEHRIKRSDLTAEFGARWSEPLVHLRSGEPPGRIQSPDSQRVRFRSKSLCAKCNNELSQPFDEAYSELVGFALAHTDSLTEALRLDLPRIWGCEWREQSLNVARYVVKHAFCQIAEHSDRFEPLPDPAPFLDGGPFPSWLALDLVVDETKMLMSAVLEQADKSARGFLHVAPLWSQLSRSSDLHSEPQSSFGRRWFELAWGIGVGEAPLNPFHKASVDLSWSPSELDANSLQKLREAASGRRTPV